MESLTLTLYDIDDNTQDVTVEYLIRDGYVTYAKVLNELEIYPTYLDSDVFENIYLKEGVRGLKMGCKVEASEMVNSQY